MELTLHTGGAGDWNTIHVKWFDENNVVRQDSLEIIIREQDKPRVLEFYLNGVKIAAIDSRIGKAGK